MTDCNGATIGVGDVVEVVESQPHERGEWVVERLHDGGAILEQLGWFGPSELRLVRRKEQA